MADGQVVFEIIGDKKGINQTVEQVTDDIKRESKKWDQATDEATSDMEKSFADAAGKIVGTLAAAGIGSIIIGWGKSALEAASDLSEVQNVVDTVFGDGAKQIEAWSKKAGEQFGLTEIQAKKFTSTLGAMMKSSGLAGNEIINMSTDLAGLAADMASFYNLDFEEAFDKIRSGISGQSMPLKQLGIDMSVANLNAFALAQGLEKTFDKMDQGEQTMLRYQYLMHATADAQGDFEKTSDGFANAQRRIQSSLDSISVVAGGFILNTIEPLISKTADFLSEITKQPERTILDDFNDIGAETQQKMDDLNEVARQAQSVIDLLKEIEKETVTLKDGSTISFGELFKDIGNIEAQGGDVRGYIESLGLNVDEVILKYNTWKESTRQLTSLVPSLTSVINSETGAIEGGTDALQENLDQWKANEEKKIAWAGYYAKERALAEKKGEMSVYEFNAGTARTAAERARKELEDAFGAAFDQEGKYKGNLTWTVSAAKYDDEFLPALNKYNKLLQDQEKAEAELERQTIDLSAAEEYVAEEKERLIGLWGEEIQEMGDAGDAANYAGKSAQEWVDALKGAPAAAEAIKAVIDYYKGVRDATEQAVNSTIKGFEEMELAGDKTRKKQEELDTKRSQTEKEHSKAVAELKRKYGEGWLEKASQNYDKLTDAQKKAYNALAKIKNEQAEVNKELGNYKPEGMIANLQSQIKYMEDYLKNLNTLKEWGVSDEMLAFLSDGSKESAEYLAGLVAGGDKAAKDAALEVDKVYQEVNKQKKTFTDTLTEQKLTVDDTYNAMVEKAKEAMEGLDMGEKAQDALASTVQGIAAGIRDNVGEVSSAVTALMDALNPLSSLGFTWGFQGGSFILERNSGVDYDTLGNVISNTSSTGNVYLDGKTVGKVVSGMQGNQYRSMQRSGWRSNP
ncbi:MAG: hypothetical protein IIZ93_01540 [Acidaminococcaceae bacterium]|nr:hypothetical protein [Acidaminococcaceae bacterium]